MTNNTSFLGRKAENKTITRLQIKGGKICKWVGQGQPMEQYDYAVGTITGISVRKKETTSGEMAYMDIHFVNGEDRFDISTIASSGIAADLVSRIANVQDFSHQVKVEVWARDNFTNAAVYENGERLPFIILPKPVKVPRRPKRGSLCHQPIHNRDQVTQSLVRGVTLADRLSIILPKVNTGHVVAIHLRGDVIVLKREGKPFRLTVDSPVAVVDYRCGMLRAQPALDVFLSHTRENNHPPATSQLEITTPTNPWRTGPERHRVSRFAFSLSRGDPVAPLQQKQNNNKTHHNETIQQLSWNRRC